MLTVGSLSKRYRMADQGLVGGVKDVSFAVTPGEFFTLLGPSGCGKTTTLRCVAGLEEPSNGRIAINDGVVFDNAAGTNIPSNRRNIGMVFQSYAVWPHMTVFENTAFPLRMSRTQRLPKDEIVRRVTKTLRTMGLEEYASRSAAHLSGGQQQRLSLARALVAEPRLLLLDEPLSNLDAVLRDQMRVELRRLQREVGVASIYVTHDQSEALALSDRVAIMKDGHIVQVDTPQAIYHAPASAFVATFVGRTNCFDGRVRDSAAAGSIMKIESAIGSLVARARSNFGAGDRVAAMIRPEYVDLEPARPSVSLQDNQVRGHAVAIAFMGEITEFRIAAEGGVEITVRKSVSEGIDIGLPLVVTFQPERLFALPPNE